MHFVFPKTTWLFGNRLSVVVGFLICFLPMIAQAAIFDWDQTYAVSPAASGTPTVGNSASQTYDNDPNHTGNDITITLANTVGTWSSPRPSVDTSYDGGTGQNALSLGFATETGTSTGLTVTIAFLNYSGGVTGVKFQIFDVDYTRGTWIDKIDQIWAVTTSGTITGALSVVGSTYNTVTGSGTSYAATGVTGNSLNTSAGNVSIDFGTATVTQVSFRWRNVDNGKGDQKIGLSDITYQPVTPEVNSGLAAMALCATVVGIRRFRKRKNTPRRLPLPDASESQLV